MCKKWFKQSKKGFITKSFDALLYILIVGISGCFAILVEHAQQFGSGVISVIGGYPISFETVITYAKKEYGVTVLIAFILILIFGGGFVFLQHFRNRFNEDSDKKLDKIIEILTDIRDKRLLNEQENKETTTKDS